MPPKRRRRTREEPRPAGLPERYDRKFGWCVDGDHKGCRKEYVDWNDVPVFCNCTCHSALQKPATSKRRKT